VSTTESLPHLQFLPRSLLLCGSEVPRVESQSLQSLLSLTGNELTVDDPQSRRDLGNFSIDTSEVDILMGTLTKSFGANGGYIAADKVMIAP
jgi:hypothetical protein